MPSTDPVSRTVLALRLALVVALTPVFLATAQTSPAGTGAKPLSATPAKKPARKPPPTAPRRKPAAALAPAPATVEQLAAAERVFYGLHDCEFGQSVDVALNPTTPGYVDVSFAKARYLMRPVLSSTGAVRLEDVDGAALMVQITAKSMLMDVKAGRRLVDECISAKHREAVEAAAHSAEAASAAAIGAAIEAASAPMQ